MIHVNKVIIIGEVSQDPELKYTSNNKAVCNLNVATKKSYIYNGERKESTSWHKVTVWGKQAEECKEYLSEGSGVAVDGRLQTRSYDDREGNKRWVTEVVASDVKFDDNPNREFKSEYESKQGQETFEDKKQELSDDDLPF